MIEIRRATADDAQLLAQTRKVVWEQTYRGIYPDDMIGRYDLRYYTERDRRLLLSAEHHYYLFVDNDSCVGYFSFGPSNYGKYKDFDLCLNNLYICNGYKGMGLGRNAFAYIRKFATQQGISKFFCGCNLHNPDAQGFYRHMGGTIGKLSSGHKNRSEDIIHFEFHIGD